MLIEFAVIVSPTLGYLFTFKNMSILIDPNTTTLTFYLNIKIIKMDKAANSKSL